MSDASTLPEASALPMPGRWQPVAVAVASAVTLAAAGAALTDLGPWYYALRQPAWKPPDWAFGPIWTSIFTLSATAGVIGWRLLRGARRRTMVGLFAANGVLNAFWSLLYFRLKRPDWALLEVPFLWLSVLALIVLLGRDTKLAAWLLVPYLVWVSLASVLNFDTVKLNGPFVA